MLFRDGHSLVTNLCYVTLIDVSKHTVYANLDLSLCKHKLVFYGFNIMA